MDWKDRIYVSAGLAGIAALFLTFAITSFTRLDSDLNDCLQEIRDMRKETNDKFNQMQALIYEELRDFQKEMREIHGRISVIEEREKLCKK